MSRNPFKGPEWESYAEHVRKDMVPKMEDSAYVMSLIPDDGPDVKFAVELGFSIMLDKPIIAVVRPGMRVPAKLVAVADEIVEWDSSDRENTDARLLAAVDRLKAKLNG